MKRSLVVRNISKDLYYFEELDVEVMHQQEVEFMDFYTDWEAAHRAVTNKLSKCSVDIEAGLLVIASSYPPLGDSYVIV